MASIISNLVLTKATKTIRTLYQGESIFNQAGWIGGEKDNKPIIRLEKFVNGREKGSKVRIPLRSALHKGGVRGDDTLAGNEEDILYSTTDVDLDQQRHAVKTAGKFDEQKAEIAVREDLEPALRKWAGHNMDVLAIDACRSSARSAAQILAGDPADTISYATDHIVILPDGVAAVGDLTLANGKLTVPMLRKIATASRVYGIPQIPFPGAAAPIYGVLLVTPSVYQGLTEDEEWQEANRYAANRGINNPIFTYANAMFENILVMIDIRDPDAEAVKNGSILTQQTMNNAYDICECIFFGAGALGYAPAYKPDLNEDANNDYGNLLKLGVSKIEGFARTTIESPAWTKDADNIRSFGMMHIPVAASMNLAA